MLKAPFKDRLDFYRYTSASLCMVQAKDILRELKELDAQEREPGIPAQINYDQRKNALWHAFFTVYSKPFKQSRDAELEVGLRILDDHVPEGYKEVHKSIITLRDQMYSHTDFHQMTDSNGNPMNKIVVFGVEGCLYFGQTFAHPLKTDNKWTELVDELYKRFKYRKGRIWDSWKRGLGNLQDERWILNMSPHDDDILKRDRCGRLDTSSTELDPKAPQPETL